MKLTKNFELREFVPAETYTEHGEGSIQQIDRNLANGAQLVRDHLKVALCVGDVVDISMQINTWAYGGDMNYRGYRPPSCEVGAKESQHRFGRAIDFDIIAIKKDGARLPVDSLEIQRIIKSPDVWKYLKTYFTTIESGTVGWTHLDMRFIDASLYIKSPFLIEIPK